MARFYDLIGYLQHLKREAARGIAPAASDARYTPALENEKAVLKRELDEITRTANGIVNLVGQEYIADKNGGMRSMRLDEYKPKFPSPKEETNYAEHIRYRLERERLNEKDREKDQQREQLQRAQELESYWREKYGPIPIIKKAQPPPEKKPEPDIDNTVVKEFNCKRIYCPCCWREHA
jgi:hypothetical protein